VNEDANEREREMCIVHERTNDLKLEFGSEY
jgi:hypothetical protein